MRRAQLVFGGALALCLLLHPASASLHDDVPTTDDDELDEEDYYGEDVEDVYAHVEVLLERDDGAADGLAAARAAANERAGLGGSSSAPVGRPGPDADWSADDIQTFFEAASAANSDADLNELYPDLSIDQVKRLKKKYGLTKRRDLHSGVLPSLEELLEWWTGEEGLQMFPVDTAVTALARLPRAPPVRRALLSRGQVRLAAVWREPVGRPVRQQPGDARGARGDRALARAERRRRDARGGGLHVPAPNRVNKDFERSHITHHTSHVSRV